MSATLMSTLSTCNIYIVHSYYVSKISRCEIIFYSSGDIKVVYIVCNFDVYIVNN